ncbi:hypothetical protein C8F04DRAFT_1197905 [Mycena alexandri]|uniref:F-box domain-containing protein n=1 Tax=Mycena alexandri TaxID=1745969 RepID=A0AAD6S5E2_9AGAR|nr:hypothetical protein C8F04DRAFT_1197905 [Mycena alexandri]
MYCAAFFAVTSSSARALLMNGALTPLWLAYFACMCFGARVGGGGFVHATAGLVRGGAHPLGGVASTGLAVFGTGFVQTLANAAGASLDTFGPPAFGPAFARSVGPEFQGAAVSAISKFLPVPGSSGGDVRAVANAAIGSRSVPYAGPASAFAHRACLLVGGAEVGSLRSRPVPGRAGYTDPFIGRVCGTLVWIEQSASLGLPNELLFKVFAHAVGTYVDTDPDRHSYYESLFAVAGACRHWNSYVADCGGLWSTFRLTPHRLAASLVFWMSRIHRSPVDLRLSFDDLFALYHPRSTARAPRLGVRNSILHIAPAFNQCARLCIDAEASFAFPLLMQLLSIASGHLLVSLSLSRVYFAFLEDRVPPIDPTPNLFFQTGVPNLRFLRLVNAAVGWGNLDFYKRLEVFKLWGMRPPINPTADQLYAILVVARLLVRLSFREVECDALSLCAHPLFRLPALVELDLHLSGTLGVPEVLSRCRAPALRKLTLILDSDFDVRCLLACTSILERVVVLSLQVAGVPRESMSDLWSRFPLVERLDVSCSDVVAFNALDSPDGVYDTPILCPRLSQLTVRSVPPSDMKKYLQRRAASGFALRRLMMYQAVDFFEENEGELTWIAGNFGAGEFLMDPESDVDSSAGWLIH